MDKPVLTEPGVKYFMNEVLKTCKDNRTIFTNSVFNLVLFLIFILIRNTSLRICDFVYS